MPLKSCFLLKQALPLEITARRFCILGGIHKVIMNCLWYNRSCRNDLNCIIYIRISLYFKTSSIKEKDLELKRERNRGTVWWKAYNSSICPWKQKWDMNHFIAQSCNWFLCLQENVCFSKLFLSQYCSTLSM